MDHYYHHFLTSMSGVGGYPAGKTDELITSTLPHHPLSVSGLAMQNSYHYLHNLGSLPDQHNLHISNAGKARKKSMTGPAFGFEHVKHRRTRSGCFMCRSRRIKVLPCAFQHDEVQVRATNRTPFFHLRIVSAMRPDQYVNVRPPANQSHFISLAWEDKPWSVQSVDPQIGCKKGNRDCVYPDPPTSKSAKSKDGRSSPQRTSPKSPNEDENGDDDQDTKSQDAVMDEYEPVDSSPDRNSECTRSDCRTRGSSNQDFSRRESADSASQNANIKLCPPSTSIGHNSAPGLAVEPSMPTEGYTDWSHLPPDYQHYLNHYVENITSFHYSISHDEESFFGRVLPSLAVHHEPLLNAVVGFSAYHLTLRNPNGKLQEFLKYYNRSVTLLLESINNKQMDNVLTLVTILQLLTIEEYFGDWTNLMGHQKAAFQVIRKIFSPESILKTVIGRACLEWYTRYDCFVALMGGFPTDLPKEWFHLMNNYHQSRMVANPDDLNSKISLRSTELRAISYDMSMLYARGSRGQIEPQDFAQEHSRITEMLLEWKSTWNSVLLLPEYLVTDYSYRTMADPDDIVDPYMPGLLYKGPLFTNTLINTEWESIMIMHLSQSADTPAEQVFMQMAKHAYTICQHFETVEYWPLKPKGALIPLQCCVSLASLFLPRDSRHQMWVRRKLALLETWGFIYPSAQRMKLAQLFRDPSCARWWLPNDQGLTPVLQAVRAFADERNTAAVNAQYENIREVRHIFAKLETAEVALMQAARGNRPH